MKKLELVDVLRRVTKERREEYSEDDTLFEFYCQETGLTYVLAEIENESKK